MPLPAVTSILRRVLDALLLALIIVVLTTLVVARVVPALTGAPTFVVGGGSMEPSIHLGSMVVDRPVPSSDLAVGDVVSIKVGPGQTVFTHRIIRLVPRDNGLWIATKGDANATADPSLVPATAVVGREEAVIPWLGYVVQLLSNVVGVAFLVSLGVLTLVGAWALEIAEEDRRDAGAALTSPAATVAVDQGQGTGATG